MPPQKQINPCEHLNDGTTRIFLKNGFSCVIDTNDYDKVKPIRWFARDHNNSGVFYVDGSTYKNKQKDILLMHRVLLDLKRYDGLCVDHINRDGLDNRRSNLRICTTSQNSMNRKIQKNKSSKYKGVSWIKKTKKWYASIKHNGKSFNLGFFDNEIKAFEAYKKAASKMFGPYARFN